MLLAWTCAWTTCVAHAAAPEAATVPGAGEQEAVFTVDAFGRYAVTAQSPHGAAVRVVDAMAGPGRLAGVAGERDGRLDVFLDRGRIKVQSVSPAAATDDVTLKVAPFAAPPTPPRLVERRAVKDTLRDLETRAWWVDVPAARSLALEAAGRHVGDLRLWRDGAWLVDATPRCAAYEPTPGRPWQRCQLTAAVEPGLYLVTAYGGPGDAWAEESPEAPLVVRWSAPALGAAGRRTEVVGADGVLRYELPRSGNGGPDTFVLTLADVAVAELRVGTDPFGAAGVTNRITTESRRPVTHVTEGQDSPRTVVITAPPGTPATLTWFAAGTSATLSNPGRSWVSTVSSADPADVMDPGAVITRRMPDGKVIRVDAQGARLDASHGLQRKLNLAARTTVLLEIGAAGPYVARVDGVDATVRIEPYLTSRPRDYQSPKPGRGSFSADLEAGLYLLELVPSAPGIAELTVAHDSWASRAKRTVGLGGEAITLRPAVQFADVGVERGGALDLTVFAPPGAPTGVVVRALPVRPVDPLPMTLLPTESVSVPIQVDQAGQLTATTPSGKTLPLSVDGGPEVRAVPVPTGLHTVRVRSDQPGPVFVSLALVPDALSPDRPLPALDPARLAALPDFPDLAIGAPRFTDLEAGRSTTWALTLPEPGLYVVESTGLLATSGAIRTRTITSLATASTNGVGRNFAIARYLGAGEYQLTTSALAPSAGRLGLRARRTAIAEGGVVPLERDARATVPAGDAVRYRFTLDQPGAVHILHRGRAGPFRCRIEDGDGWPVTAPDQPCDVQLDLRAGTYVVIGLPELVQTRRITEITALRDDERREGHGPFALELGVTADHVWVEPAGEGEQRPPDVWEVALQAPVSATVHLSAEMAGTLSVGEAQVARLVPGEPWTGTVPAGTARLEIRGARRGTGVPYRLRVDTDELVAGARRAVQVPAELPVSVGAPGVYTFASSGDRDVRATLRDASGRVVGANDDRPDDWNFQLSARLDPGRYVLRVEDVDGPTVPTYRGMGGYAAPSYEPEPAYEPDYGYDEGGGDTGGSGDEPSYEEPSYEPSYEDEPIYVPSGWSDGGDVVVHLRAPRDTVGPPIQRGKPVTVRPGADAVLLPIASGRADVVCAEATSDENVGVAIESDDAPGGGWRALAHGTGRRAEACARPAGTAWRLRVWSEDARGGEVVARVAPLDAAGVDDDGTRALEDLDAVKLRGGPGAFQVTVEGAGAVWACPEAAAGCEAVGPRPVAAGDAGLVLVGRGSSVHTRRIRLGAAPEIVNVGAERRVVDLADAGAVVVVARGPMGRPGVAIGGQAAIGVGDGAAVAVSADKASRIEVWSGTGERMDVRISALPLRDVARQALRDGRTPVTVPPGAAVVLGVDKARDLTAALGAGLVLAAADGRVAWAEGDGRTVSLPSVSGKLVLANPTDRPGLAAVDLAEGERPEPLAAGAPLEALPTDRATWLLPVAEGEGTLHLTGATGAYVREDGRLFDLDAAPAVGAGGVLVVDAEPGPVVAWIETAPGQGPTRPARAGRSQKVSKAGEVELKGPVESLELDLGRGAVARVRVPQPAIVSVAAAGGVTRTDVLAAGGRVDVVLPEGKATVLVRAFAGAELSGVAAVSVFEPQPIAEGLGPAVLLGPDDAAWFRFTLDRQAPIGVGARAEAERVDAVLLDAAGAPLARGLVLMRELPPGDYLLALVQGPSTRPVVVQPALVGVRAPPEAPPDDVVRRYLELDGGSR